MSESLLVALRGPLRGSLYGGGAMFLLEDSNASSVVFNAIRTASHGSGSVCKCQTSPSALHMPPHGVTSTSASDLPLCLTTSHTRPREPTWMAHKGDECFLPFCIARQHWDDAAVIAKRGATCLSRTVDTPVIYLIGDSKAVQLRLGMTQAAAGRYVVRSYTCAGFGVKPQSLNRPCAHYASTVRTILQRSLRKGDIVAVAHDSTDWFIKPSVREDVLHTMEYLGQLASTKGASVLLIGDTPTLAGKGWKCIPTWFNPDAEKACSRSKEEVDKGVRPYHQALETLSQRHGNMFFFDYHDLLCSSSTCGPFIPNTKVLGMWDDDHLTAEGSRYLWPFLCSVLTDIAKDRGAIALLDQDHTLHHGPAQHRGAAQVMSKHLLQDQGPIDIRGTPSQGLTTVVAFNTTDLTQGLAVGQDRVAAVPLHLRGRRGHRGASGAPWHYRLG